MPPNTLQVIPNPYKLLDADGNPIAVYPCHGKHAPGQYVGAVLTLDVQAPAETVQVPRKDKRGQKTVETIVARLDRSKARFAFTTSPVELPAGGAVGAYYRAGIASGVLLPADAATARACGLRFEPVETVLARERKEAAKTFEREFGVAPVWASASATNPAPLAQ